MTAERIALRLRIMARAPVRVARETAAPATTSTVEGQGSQPLPAAEGQDHVEPSTSAIETSTSQVVSELSVAPQPVVSTA